MIYRARHMQDCIAMGSLLKLLASLGLQQHFPAWGSLDSLHADAHGTPRRDITVVKGPNPFIKKVL